MKGKKSTLAKLNRKSLYLFFLQIHDLHSTSTLALKLMQCSELLLSTQSIIQVHFKKENILFKFRNA